MNASVIVGLVDSASSGLRNIGGMAEQVQAKVQALQSIRFAGFAGVGAGLGIMTATGAAIASVSDEAMKFQDVMTNVSMAGFGKDLLDQSKAEEIKQTLGDLETGFEKLGIATKFSDTKLGEAALGMLRGGLSKEFLLGSKDATGNWNYSGLAAAAYTAQLGEIDPNAAGDFVAKMKAAYNLDGDRTLEASNYFAKVSAASTVDYGNLISGMQTAAGVSGQLYMSPEDTALLVAATGTYTKDGGAAGTFTKDFLDRLMPHSKKQKQAMIDLGWIDAAGKNIFFDDRGHVKSAEFIRDVLQQTKQRFNPNDFQAMMSKVFLEQGKNTALALASDADIFGDIKGNVNNQLDMYQQIEMQMSTTRAQMESMKETWNITKRVLGEPFLEPLAKSFTWLKGIMEDMVIPWAKANPEMIKMIAYGAWVGGALLTLIGIVMLVTSTIGLMRIGMQAAGITFVRLMTMSGGVGLAIAGIGLAAYLIYKHWDKIEPYAKAVFFTLKTHAATFLAWANTNLVPYGKVLFAGIVSGLEWLSDKFEKYWPTISKFLGFTERFDDLSNTKVITWEMPDWALWIGGLIIAGKLLDGAIFGPIRAFRALSGAVSNSSQWLRYMTWLFRNNVGFLGMFRAALMRIPGARGLMAIARASRFVFGGLFRLAGGGPAFIAMFRMIGLASWGLAKGLFAPFWMLGRGVIYAIPYIMRFGIWLLRLAAQSLIFAARMAVSWLIAMGPIGWIILGVTAIIAAAVYAWQTNLWGFRDKVTAMWAWAKEHWIAAILIITGPIGWIIGLAIAAWNNNFLGFRDKVSGVWEWVKDKTTTFLSWLENLPDRAKQWGANLIQSFIKGIEDKLDKMPDSLKKAASTIADWLGVHSPTKSGPLRTNHLWGGNLIQSFAAGMLSSMPALHAATALAAGAAVLPSAGSGSGRLGLDGGGRGIPARSAGQGEKQEFHFHYDGMQIHVGQTEKPADVEKFVFSAMEKWARERLPRHVEQINSRVKAKQARYKPGLQ